MSHVSIDFETFYSSKLKYSLKSSIAETYCRHNLFDPYLISASDGKTNWAGHPRDFNWKSLEGQVVVAHNAYFEKSILIEMERRGWIPPVLSTIKHFHCTANLTAYLCNRRALDNAVEYLYNVRLSKESRSDANNKHWADFSPEAQKAMTEYARRDAYWCWRLFNDHYVKWPHMEKELSRITIDQGLRGTQINTNLLDEYICQTHEMLQSTEKQIPWMRGAIDDEAEIESWDDFNKKPTSTKCIAEQCRRTGIPCPPVKSDDEEGYQEWENTYGPHHAWIAAISAWRSVNKLYKTFLKVKTRVRADGSAPFSLKYFGAHTGRWAGEAGVNMQNMRKKPVLCNQSGLMELDPKREKEAADSLENMGRYPEWVKYSIDFRHLIVPRPGKKMITSDLSQIEPRVLLWLAGDKKTLALMANGMSPYEAHARATMGWTGGDLKYAAKSDPAAKQLYALAKARVLALGYQAGWEKFITMAATLADLDITKDDPEFFDEINQFTGDIKRVSGYGLNSKRIVNEYREQNPLIAHKETGLWTKLDQAFKRSVGSDFTMTMPSGRVLKYDKVRCEARIEPDPETGKPKRKTVFTADVGGKRVMLYGGKLTENITQALSRDVFGFQIVNMDQRGWWNLFSVHDEAILEVDQDVTVDDVRQEMSRCPEWLRGCPIACDTEEVPHYKK